MKRRPPSCEWFDWRRRRYRQLARQGLKGHLAWNLADVEMQARRRVADAIGFQRATAAKLEVVGSGESSRIVLIGDAKTLTSEQASALKKVAA